MKKNNLRILKLMNRNILIDYVNAGLIWGRFFIPVLALFYIASQVTLAQFSIIMSVFALSTLLLEIPTGVLADFIGKRKTLILSRLMYLVEVILIAFFNGFWIFLIAKFISGIGVSLSSGTSSAMRYDSLKKIGKEEDYKRISGKSSFIGSLSMAFVFIIGAYLFSLNTKLPAKLSLIPLGIGFILTFFMIEPYKSNKRINFKNSYAHLTKGLGEFFSNKFLVYLALLTLLIESSANMMLSYSSVYFEKIFIPIGLIGIISFISSLIMAFSSKRAYLFEKRFGSNSLLILQAVTFLSIFLMSFMIPYVGVLFYLLIPFALASFTVIVADLVNHRAKTNNRATMLSINNMFYSIGAFLFFPALGFLEKSYSLNFALFGFSLFLLVGFVVIGVYKKIKIRN
jgi:MFS family permease